MSTGEVTTLRLERTFAATPQEAYDAWTSPEVLTRWWAARPDWNSPGCDVDLRVGGRYALRMRDDTGQLHVVGGEYRVVDPPTRLVFTWCWEGEGGPHPGHVSLVTVEFIADGDRTRIVLEHSGLPSEESRVRHSLGWNGTLDNLARRIFDSPDES